MFLSENVFSALEVLLGCYRETCFLHLLLGAADPQARQLRRRLRRNPGDEQAQRELAALLQREAAAEKAPADAEGSAGTVAGEPGGLRSAESQEKGQGILPDLQRFGVQGAPQGEVVDAGALTSLLSREIQEALHIEDENVSRSLASRVVKWGCWSGAFERKRKKDIEKFLPFLSFFALVPALFHAPFSRCSRRYIAPQLSAVTARS